MGRAAVSSRDDVDDGETEPGACAGARLVAPAESLERVRDELRSEARPLVADVELDVTVPPLRLQADAAATVAQGVLDEVAECLLNAQAIDGDL